MDAVRDGEARFRFVLDRGWGEDWVGLVVGEAESSLSEYSTRGMMLLYLSIVVD